MDSNMDCCIEPQKEEVIDNVFNVEETVVGTEEVIDEKCDYNSVSGLEKGDQTYFSSTDDEEIMEYKPGTKSEPLIERKLSFNSISIVQGQQNQEQILKFDKGTYTDTPKAEFQGIFSYLNGIFMKRNEMKGRLLSGGDCCNCKLPACIREHEHILCEKCREYCFDQDLGQQILHAANAIRSIDETSDSEDSTKTPKDTKRRNKLRKYKRPNNTPRDSDDSENEPTTSGKSSANSQDTDYSESIDSESEYDPNEACSDDSDY